MRRHVHVCASPHCGNVWSCRREDCDPYGYCRDCEDEQRLDYLADRYDQQARIHNLPRTEQRLPLEVF
jgi:hypothetical protein